MSLGRLPTTGDSGNGVESGSEQTPRIGPVLHRNLSRGNGGVLFLLLWDFRDDFRLHLFGHFDLHKLYFWYSHALHLHHGSLYTPPVPDDPRSHAKTSKASRSLVHTVHDHSHPIPSRPTQPSYSNDPVQTHTRPTLPHVRPHLTLGTSSPVPSDSRPTPE